MATENAPSTISTVTVSQPSSTPITTVTTVVTKPGWKTSEFWLAALASVLGILYASGMLNDGSSNSKLVGLIVTALASAGYSVSRGNAKAAGA